MADKPAFDPSQPFSVEGGNAQSTAKPEFDPSQPFEVLQPAAARSRSTIEQANDALDAFSAGGLSALTFGLSDQAISKGVEALVPNADQNPFVSKFTSKGLKKLAEENPEGNVLGQIGGTAVGLLTPGALGGVAKLGGAAERIAAKALGVGAAKSAAQIGAEVYAGKIGVKTAVGEISKRAAAAGAGSAVEGTFYGLGNLVHEEALGNADFTAESLLWNGGLGAVLGGGAGVVGKLISEGAPATYSAIKEAVKDSKFFQEAGAKVRDMANWFSARSLGIYGPEFKKLLKYGKVDDVGEYLLQKEIIPKSGQASWNQIQTGLKREQDRVGPMIGEQLEAADGLAQKSSSNAEKLAVPRGEFIERAQNEIVAPLLKSTSKKDAALRVNKWLEDFLEVNPEATVSLSKLNQEAADLKTKIKFNAGLTDTDDVTRQAFSKLRTMMKEEFVAPRMVEAAKLRGLPETAWKDAQKEYATISFAKDAIDYNMQRVAQRRIASPSDYASGIAGGIMSTVKGVAPVTTGTVVLGSALLNKLARERGSQMTAAGLQALANSIEGVEKAGVLGRLERTINGQKRTINDAAARYLKNERRVVAPVTVKLALPEILPHLGLSDGDDYESRLNELSVAASDPAALTEKIAHSLEGLSIFAPQTSEALAMKGTMALQFLYEKAPKKTNPDLPFQEKTPYQPSDFDLGKFSRYVKAVQEPYSVIEDLESGRLSTEGVEALERVYPQMYESLRSAFLDLAHEAKGLSYYDKLQLSQLLKLNLVDEVIPDAFGRFQQRFQMPSQEEAIRNEQKMKQSGLMKLSGDKSALTDNQRREFR